MTKRFELHLEGMDVPEGLIDADRLVDIVRSLQDMATRLGRIETESAHLGRPNKNLDRVASLRIGLDKGSTTIVAERDTRADALDLDLPDEEAVDRRFAELIEGVGADERPAWVTDSLARSAGDLVAALQKTAPRVELRVDGVRRRAFETQSIHRETWSLEHAEPSASTVEFTGRLFAVNLNTHRLQVQDDVGHRVALPKVAHDMEASRLIGSYVTVTGTPEIDAHGRVSSLREATIAQTTRAPGFGEIPTAHSLDDILASAPGLQAGGIEGLTDAEADAFFEAMGL